MLTVKLVHINCCSLVKTCSYNRGTLILRDIVFFLRLAFYNCCAFSIRRKEKVEDNLKSSCHLFQSPRSAGADLKAACRQHLHLHELFWLINASSQSSSACFPHSAMRSQCKWPISPNTVRCGTSPETARRQQTIYCGSVRRVCLDDDDPFHILLSYIPVFLVCIMSLSVWDVLVKRL